MNRALHTHCTRTAHARPSKLYVTGTYLRDNSWAGYREVGRLQAPAVGVGQAVPFALTQFLRYLHRGLGSAASKPKVCVCVGWV